MIKIKGNLVKIIYFDEDSALDYLDIHQGGRYYFNADDVSEFNSSLKAGANAKIEAGSKIPFLNLLFSGHAGAAVSKEGNKLIEATLSNTVLTDFIHNVSDPNEKNTDSLGRVSIFSKIKVEIVKDSYAYFNVITPFTKILDEKVIETDEATIDVTEMDEMLEKAKGYYELLAIIDKQKIVLRFNSKSFRNNYRLFDLEKMNLSYYGIKVGECSERDLILENQMPSDIIEDNNQSLKAKSLIEAYDNHEFRNSTTDTTCDTPEYPNELLDIYDVILAGIEHD